MFVCEWTSLLGQDSFCQVLAQSVLLMAELQSLTKWGLQWKSCQLLVCDGMCTVPGHGASQPQLIQGEKRGVLCLSFYLFHGWEVNTLMCQLPWICLWPGGESGPSFPPWHKASNTHTQSQLALNFSGLFCFSACKCQLTDLQSVLTLF